MEDDEEKSDNVDDYIDSDSEVDIYDVIDRDNTTEQQYVSRDLVRQLIGSSFYQLFCIIIILTDVILVSLGTNRQLVSSILNISS